MTTQQLKALDALRKDYDYLEHDGLSDPWLHVDCYRTADVPPVFKGSYDLQRIGQAIIRDNGFVDFYPARAIIGAA